MAILVQDSFNRADDAITPGIADTGQTWNVYSLGTTTVYGISSNQLYMVNAGGYTDQQFTGFDVGISDVKITATFTTIGNRPFMVMRASASNNHLMFQARGTTYVLYYYNGSTYTTLGTATKTATNGDIIEATLQGTSVSIKINGTIYISVTTTNNQNATKFGLSAQTATNARFDDFSIESLATGGGTSLTLSLSDSITLGESFTKIRSGKLTLTDSINATESSSIKSTRFLSLVDSITTVESFTKIRQAYLSLADGLTIGDTETSTKTTINTLVRVLSDSINMTDSITIRAMRYLTIFDLFSIVDSIGTTGGGNVAQTIKFKRGNEVDLPTLAEGEPAITMDTNKMFVGTPNGNRQIATLLVVDSVANLPIAEKSKQFLISGVLGGTGTADALYVCKKLSNDTYDWVQFV
jgi:hypothetical protein